MIVGIGLDLVETARIRDIFSRHRERFLNRILTDAEREYVLRHADPVQRIAGRWTAKEAALKALGTGLSQGIRWRDVEILNNPAGKPELYLHARAADIARELGANTYHVTLTHLESTALGQVILERV